MSTATTTAHAADPENTLYLDLKDGRVVIELMPDLAPRHVEQIKTLTRQGFYNGLAFHRVIDGFMAQTGHPEGPVGKSGLPDLKAEFNQYPFDRGVVGMARTNDPNSANSQWFICFAKEHCQHLTGQYTVFAKVTQGMEFVDKIKRGEPPSNPDRIIKLSVAADGEAGSAPQGTNN